MIRTDTRVWHSGSNRTFMELKYGDCGEGSQEIGSSNRTFMELKFIREAKRAAGAEVLIVPLWN